MPEPTAQNRRSIKLYRIAAILAAVIGLMGVLAGGNVLLGWRPGYTVIPWLPLANLIVGLLALFVAAPLLWRQSRLALPLAVAILGANVLILLFLLTAYRGQVAAASLAAMLFRIAAWLLIAGLPLYSRRATEQTPG